MWLNDNKLTALLDKWNKVIDSYPGDSYVAGLADFMGELENLIEEEEAMLPPPVSGSRRCMIYGGDHV